jgi:hypothetical protein
VGKDWSRSESSFKCFKGEATIIREIPRGILSGEAGEGYNDVRVIKDKTSVEIGKPEEGLNVLYFPGLGPVDDGLDLFGRHGQAGRRQ